MSRQHTTQAPDQGILERVFKLCEHSTTTWIEVIVDSTTFLMMVYIVFVNPQILGVAGMDTNAAFITIYLVATFDSIMIGLFANLSVALTPAVGLNAFPSFVVVQAMGLPWQVGMGTIFWGATSLLLLTIFRVRYWMIANIPVSPRVDIISGIGLFIDMMGPKDAGMIAADPETLVSIGNLTSYSILLGILGFFIIVILASRNIYAAVLVSIMMTTLLSWILGDVYYNDIISAPPSVMSVVGHVGLVGSFNLGLAGVIFSFVLANSFDSSGTLIDVTDKVGLVDEKGKFPHVEQVLYANSISSVIGSFIGTSSVTAYTESSFDVSVGGRTGLTAVAVGLLFSLITFLSLLVETVPDYTAADVLIYAGVLMTSSLARVNWQDLTGSVPAFITTVMMPFSFSITEGIVPGFISYCMMEIGTGYLRDLSLCVIIVALLFVLKIVFIDAR